MKLTVLNNRILTFTNWEDNSTDAVREISMDGDKQVLPHSLALTIS